MFLRSFMLLTALLLLSFRPAERVRVWLIGDSTVSDYPPSRAPMAGWGTPFATFFDSSVIVENHARGGRSTRTFLSEGRWQKVLRGLSKGDYVLIQFGHNDEAKEEKYKDRYTPVPDYKANLNRFITEARAKGAIPVLLTPVSRWKMSEGKALETHTEYSAAVLETGRASGTPVIDLDGKSRRLYEAMGADWSKLLFVQLPAGEHPNYPEGLRDNTHFSEYGARRIAELVLEGLREQGLPLTQRLAKPAGKK